ncbi:uncharacterized protein [Elaeis guineensis]|uniref:uncharacterized protein n=1 Tax=Elaeis guineensis var. tenera TaxID=51953 RepID=UPI003C6D94C1
MALITEELKAKAKVCYGDEICQEKSKSLLQEVGLPRGLLTLKDIIECGHVEETGFVWLKQKKKTEHRFEKYDPEITAYMEKCKIRNLTGDKAKEILIWVGLNEISVDGQPTGELTCKGPMGFFRTFPTWAFELEE